MSLVTKYSESPVKLMENQKLVEIQFPNTATEIIGLKTDNLTKIDVTKCSKDFVSTVKSSYQDKSNNSGGSIEVVEPQPNNEIWYYATVKLDETTYNSSSGLHINALFGATKISHTFTNGKGVLTFNGDVTSIGNFAFSRCSGLTSIEIPNSVTSIGQYAFTDCTGLLSIDIPNSVTEIGNCAFESCRVLISIDIPDSVTRIGQYTFNDCTGLTSVTIGNSVTTIDLAAFQYCSKITSITIPDSVTSIGNDAFYQCSGLTSVVYKGTTYTSKSAIESALKTNGVSVGKNVFDGTGLS